MTDQSHSAEGWLREHGDYLFRYAIAQLRDEELSADLVQETLLAAWRGRDSFQGKSSVRTWLTSILKHKILDHIRVEIRLRRFNETIEADPTANWFEADGSWKESIHRWQDNPEELCRNEQFMKILQMCIDRLPEKQNLVFRMKELAGEETATICNEAGISPTNLHVMIHRARLALRGCLDLNWFGGAKTS